MAFLTYDDLLAEGFTDRMAARYLRVCLRVAEEGMRLARVRRLKETSPRSNFPLEALQRFGAAGAPWQDVSHREPSLLRDGSCICGEATQL